ncbi:hypothetical protein LT493_43830 [Streptomyces tricolor]|nr:hypothetical protein [Streptomyces tricolor]
MSPELFVLIVHHVGDPAEVEKHTPRAHRLPGEAPRSGRLRAVRPDPARGVRRRHPRPRRHPRRTRRRHRRGPPSCGPGSRRYTVFTMGARRAHPDVLKAVRGEIR